MLVHRDIPLCPSIPPSLLSHSAGWGIKDFSSPPFPSPLQRGGSVPATSQITATSSSVIKPLQEGDISHTNIFIFMLKTWAGSPQETPPSALLR